VVGATGRVPKDAANETQNRDLNRKPSKNEKWCADGHLARRVSLKKGVKDAPHGGGECICTTGVLRGGASKEKEVVHGRKWEKVTEEAHEKIILTRASN